MKRIALLLGALLALAVSIPASAAQGDIIIRERASMINGGGIDYSQTLTTIGAFYVSVEPKFIRTQKPDPNAPMYGHWVNLEHRQSSMNYVRRPYSSIRATEGDFNFYAFCNGGYDEKGSWIARSIANASVRQVCGSGVTWEIQKLEQNGNSYDYLAFHGFKSGDIVLVSYNEDRIYLYVTDEDDNCLRTYEIFDGLDASDAFYSVEPGRTIEIPYVVSPGFVVEEPVVSVYDMEVGSETRAGGSTSIVLKNSRIICSPRREKRIPETPQSRINTMFLRLCSFLWLRYKNLF